MIKEVEKIPDIKLPKSIRANIRKDIDDAIKSGITTFELVGYDNCKTLAQAARQVAQDSVRKMLYDEVHKRVADRKLKTYGVYFGHRDCKKFINVYGRATRVFVSIDFSDFDEFVDKAIRVAEDKGCLK